MASVHGLGWYREGFALGGVRHVGRQGLLPPASHLARDARGVGTWGGWKGDLDRRTSHATRGVWGGAGRKQGR